MDYKKSNSIKNLGEILAVITLCITYAINEYQHPTLKVFFFIFAIIIVIIAILQHYVFCVCPYCIHHFSIKEKLPKYCPECGRKLE